MNEKTMNQIAEMKQQTIGVEVEMNNITREKAARKVAEFFGTTAWYAAGEYGYMSWACKDQQGRVWKFQRDISIHGPEAEKCEMVTPILTYEDIETLQAIIRLLRKAGAKSSPSRGCGVPGPARPPYHYCTAYRAESGCRRARCRRRRKPSAAWD